MATVNILPAADVSNDPAWTLSTGSDVYALLDDDDTGTPSGDGSQITATAAGKKCVVQFQSFDNTGVSSIDSVQAVIKHNNNTRGQSYKIGMTITNNGSGAASWAEEVTGTISANVSWQTTTFTSRATSTSGGDDWEDTDIDNIAMEIHADTLSGGTLRVTYAYFIVTYTTAVTDNSIFFGANI